MLDLVYEKEPRVGLSAIFVFFSAPGTSQKIIRVSQKKVFDILDIRGPVKGGGGAHL